MFQTAPIHQNQAEHVAGPGFLGPQFALRPLHLVRACNGDYTDNIKQSSKDFRTKIDI